MLNLSDIGKYETQTWLQLQHVRRKDIQPFGNLKSMLLVADTTIDYLKLCTALRHVDSIATLLSDEAWQLRGHGLFVSVAKMKFKQTTIAE